MPGCMHCDNHSWRMMIYLEMLMQWSKNSPSKQNMQVNGSTNKYMTHDLTCQRLELSIEPQNNAISFTSSIDFSCYLAKSRQHPVTRNHKTLEKPPAKKSQWVPLFDHFFPKLRYEMNIKNLNPQHILL